LQKTDTNRREERTAVKVDFNRRELHLIKLWWLSCEDMMIPEGTCEVCEFKGECSVIRKKLYGKNGGNNRSKTQPNNGQTTAPNMPIEEFIMT